MKTSPDRQMNETNGPLARVAERPEWRQSNLEIDQELAIRVIRGSILLASVS